MPETPSVPSFDPQQIRHAVQLLQNEEVVGMPTETVYGLAARIDSEAAIKKIFSVKQRPFFDPLIVHVASLEQAQACTAEWNAMSSRLAERFWPGPLTLVLPKSAAVSDLITSGLPSVGLRWPEHPAAQELIRQTGVPLAAPSANRFGRTSPTQAHHVREEFGDAVFVVDGDASRIGIESTVLGVKKLRGPAPVGAAAGETYELALLRPGAVLSSQIDAALAGTGLSYAWSTGPAGRTEAPGQMKHHYMPSVPLVICRDPRRKLAELSALLNERLRELPDEVEGVRMVKPAGEIKKIEFLKLSDEPPQAARELYSQLRSVSARAPDAICFIQMPHHRGEMWESVFDRLYKAASLILD